MIGTLTIQDHLEEVEACFRKAYQDIDGYALADAAKRAFPSQEWESLTYGELPLTSLLKLVEHAKPRSGEIFVDLGSGTGRLVMAAALLWPFAKSVGVEKMHALMQASKKAEKQVTMPFQGEVRWMLHDIEKADWLDGDIVLCHATCFDMPMMERIAAKAKGLKRGARMLVLGQTLPPDTLRLVDNMPYRTSWYREGMAYYYVRP